MKKLSIALVASTVLFASSAFADGLKIDQIQNNGALIASGQLLGGIKVGNVGKDFEVNNTSVANTLDIAVDGPKVDKVTTQQYNHGTVVAIQAVGGIDVGGATNATVKNLGAGNAAAISIKD